MGGGEFEDVVVGSIDDDVFGENDDDNNDIHTRSSALVSGFFIVKVFGVRLFVPAARGKMSADAFVRLWTMVAVVDGSIQSCSIDEMTLIMRLRLYQCDNISMAMLRMRQGGDEQQGHDVNLLFFLFTVLRKRLKLLLLILLRSSLTCRCRHSG